MKSRVVLLSVFFMFARILPIQAPTTLRYQFK